MAFEHLQMPDRGEQTIWEEWATGHLLGAVARQFDAANLLAPDTVFIDGVPIDTTSVTVAAGDWIALPLTERIVLQAGHHMAELSRVPLCNVWEGDNSPTFYAEARFYNEMPETSDGFTEGLRMDPSGQSWSIRPSTAEGGYAVHPAGVIDALWLGYRLSRMQPFSLE